MQQPNPLAHLRMRLANSGGPMSLLSRSGGIPAPDPSPSHASPRHLNPACRRPCRRPERLPDDPARAKGPRGGGRGLEWP